MRKQHQRKLVLHKETLQQLDLAHVRGGFEEDHRDTTEPDTGGSITCSVPFCLTLYPNQCQSIGC